MASSHNIELEAAKFLHKLIQDSTDEPAKLATKLYVILQHMKSSGKENSMPYQVISRAMETVINQHGLDIEALKSSRLPLTSGTQMGDPRTMQGAGSSQAVAVAKDSKSGMAENEMTKVDSFPSSRPPVGPSSAGHDLYQGSVSHRSGKSFDHESPSSLDTRSANSQSQEKRDAANWEKQANQSESKKTSGKRKRAESSLPMESQIDNPLQPDGCNTVVNPRKGKLMNKVEPPGTFSIKGASGKVHGGMTSSLYPAAEPVFSSPMPFSGSSHDDHGTSEKAVEGLLVANRGEGASKNLFPGRVVEDDGGISNTLINANKLVQGVGLSSTEMGVLRSGAPRDTGKSPISQTVFSGMPFKEQHLKQLRAQCLVFLAFRNGLMPKKLHLEIALGNIFPKEGGIVDGGRKELIDHKGKEQGLNDLSSIPELTVPRVNSATEAERIPPSSLSSGSLLETDPLSKVAENPKMEDKNALPSDSSMVVEERQHLIAMKRNLEAENQAQEVVESSGFLNTTSQSKSSSMRALPFNTHEDTGENGRLQVGRITQSPPMSIHKQMKPEIVSWTGIGSQSEPSRRLLPPSSLQHGPVPERKDNFSMREHWKPITGLDNEHRMVIPTRDANELFKHVSQVRDKSAELEEEDHSESTDLPPSPKYTTTEKWIMDQQKRKLLVEKNWALKQQKTERRISSCFEKLKETVSSSEDISAKTKSVIELKKLQLLELQRRLRRDFLNDFFKPIAAEMDRLKSYKKHRLGRRLKQLEKFEQKMKEERQKRIRERQKEFFSEIEVHKERLDDVFKIKRERWKGFNKYVKEFHKRKERIHREKIDRIQREKINLLKINDVEGYLRMVQDAKSDRVKQLLKETEKYLQKLGSKLRDAKAMGRRFELDMDENRMASVVEKNETTAENEDESDQAKHYMESNEKYYLMAHSIKESIAEQPTCLVGGKLREYQMNGLRWLVSLYNNHLNGILADEMGLGKTVQVIALICYLMETKNDRGPFLVVVPSSVLPGWESEINFWAPGVNKIVYAGPPEERRKLFKERIVHQKFNVLLTTYEYLMNKHDRPKLSKIHWHYVIIDEGHRIKNASCKLNADLKHYQSSHRLLLTGTPLQNNLEELWALLNFLLPNIFNSSEDFSQWFNKPFESNGDNSADEALLSEEENLLIINRLHQVLRPFVLRRLKHKVENELPEKIERLVRCEASAYQKLLMKRVEDNLGSIGNSKARSVHNSVMELRNICNHPYLSQLHVDEVDSFIPKHFLPPIVRLCGKLEMLDRLLPKLKATDHRVLFFSTMTRLLDVMEEYLTWKQYRYLRLDGHTSGNERGALIDMFNQPDSPFFIFLLSIRAGGVGVNLQAADTVIIFDTDWNPQVDLQAQARAHRIGQKREVLVLRLETVQTVEEQVRASAEHKLGVANQSITAGFFDNNTSAEDRREYLESLLRECKKEEAAPVLDDDALNDLLARSESEIDIFESVDKQRREEEMATWKKLISGHVTLDSEPAPLPLSRLVSDNDLKSFYEAMKIYEVSNAGAISNVGVKRKGEYLGGLDTQQYGRGKRAREVRSYEEQWTEEEFEKLCQVDSPDSPKKKEEVKETNLPTDVSGSIATIGNSGSPAPPSQPAAALPPPAPIEVSPLQNKEVAPPSRRGRGRPKRATVNISSSAMVLPAPSGFGKLDLASQGGTVPSLTTVHGPDSFPGSSSVKSISGTVQHFGVWIAPGSQSIPPLMPVASGTPVTPGTQSTPPYSSVPVQVKGHGQKTQSVGETPRRRGKKQSLVAPVVQVPPVPSPSEIGKMDMGSQKGTISTSVTAPAPNSLPASTSVKDASTTISDTSTRIAPCSQSATLPSVALGNHPIPPPQLEPMQVKGQGRKTQIGAGAPRRRGKKQAPVLSAVPDALVGQDPKLNEPPLKGSGDSSRNKAIAVRSMQENDAQERKNVVPKQSYTVHASVYSAGQSTKSNKQSEHQTWDSLPCGTVATRSKLEKAQELTNTIQEQACKDHILDSSADSIRIRQEKEAQELTRSIQEQTCKVHTSDSLAVPKSSKQEKDDQEESTQEQAVKGYSAADLPDLDAKPTQLSDFLSEDKQDKVAQKVIKSKQEQAGYGHASGSSVDQDAKSTELSDFSSKYKHEKDAQEMINTIKEQAGKGYIPGRLADQDAKPTPLSEYSFEKEQVAQSISTEISPAKPLETNSVCLEVSEVNKSLKSKDEIYPLKSEASRNQAGPALEQIQTAVVINVASRTHAGPVLEQIQTAAVTNVAPMTRDQKEVLFESSSSETQIGIFILGEGGSAPATLASKDSDEMSKNQRPVDKTCSTSSTVEMVPPVSELPVSECDMKVSNEKDPIQEEASVSNRPISEPESQLRSSFVVNVSEFGQRIGENAATLGNVEVISTASVNFNLPVTSSSKDKLVDPLPGKDEDALKNDVPVVPISGTFSTQVINNQICKDEVASAMLATETAALDVSVGSYRHQSEEEGDARLQLERDSVLDKALTSMPKVFCDLENNNPECLADSEQLNKESSNISNVEVICNHPGRFEAPETHSSEAKNGEFGSEGVMAPTVSQTAIEVIGKRSLEDKTYSTSMTLDAAMPVLDIPLHGFKNQSGDEDAKLVENKDPVLGEALSSKPKLCRSESVISAGSVETMTDYREPVEDNSVIRNKVDIGCSIPLCATQDAVLFSEALNSKPSLCESEAKPAAGPVEIMAEFREPVLDNSITSNAACCCSVSSSASQLDLAMTSDVDVCCTVSHDVAQSKDSVQDEALAASLNVDQNKSSVLDEPIASKPNVCEPERELASGSVEEVTDSRESMREHLIMESALPASPTVADNADDQNKDPVLEEAIVSVPDVCGPQSELPCASVVNVADSSLPLEDDSVTRTNMDLICSPLNADEMEDAACPEIFSSNDAITDSCIAASSIQVADQTEDIPCLEKSFDDDIIVDSCIAASNCQIADQKDYTRLRTSAYDDAVTDSCIAVSGIQITNQKGDIPCLKTSPSDDSVTDSCIAVSRVQIAELKINSPCLEKSACDVAVTGSCIAASSIQITELKVNSPRLEKSAYDDPVTSSCIAASSIQAANQKDDIPPLKTSPSFDAVSNAFIATSSIQFADQKTPACDDAVTDSWTAASSIQTADQKDDISLLKTSASDDAVTCIATSSIQIAHQKEDISCLKTSASDHVITDPCSSASSLQIADQKQISCLKTSASDNAITDPCISGPSIQDDSPVSTDLMGSPIKTSTASIDATVTRES